MNPAFAQLPNTLNLGRLEQMFEPQHRVLAQFVHGCSPDPATRTVAATALVLSLWQLRGRALTCQPPSMLLLNADKAAPDPLDEFAKFLVSGESNQPAVQHEGPYAQGQVEHAPEAMANALQARQKIGGLPPPHNQEHARNLEERYHAAQRTGFGSGHSRPYSGAWHKTFELLTDRADQLILRLDQGPDRAAFNQHVTHNTEKLRVPMGIGLHLSSVRKTISVSGSLTADQWTRPLTMGIIELGLPFFFLPHTASKPLHLPNRPAIDRLTTTWPNCDRPRVEASLRLPPIDWFEHYQTVLRKRLSKLPGAYEFAILQAVHQLGGVCEQIAAQAAKETKDSQKERFALSWDLHSHVLRGIVIGIVGLAWHGLGFDPGCLQQKALKVLGDLREKGPMSQSDLLRSAHLQKDARDALLHSLAAEGLVRVDGKQVFATTYSEFVQALYARTEFPEPANCWAVVTGEDKASA